MIARPRSLLGLLVVVLGVASCSERPAECAPDALAGLDALAADSAEALAPRSIEAARVDVERALAHVGDQDARWRVFRRFDAELCTKGVGALARARTDVTAARAVRNEALGLERSATATLDHAKAELTALAAFLDGGVVGPDIAARIASARSRVDDARGKLALTLGELRGAGFLGSTDGLRKVAADIDGVSHELATLSADAARSAVAQCRPRLGTSVPTFSGAPRVLDDWLMWRAVASGRAGAKEALLVFHLDRERRSCRQIAARVDAPGLPLGLGDDVRVWRAGGRVPARVLLGFSATDAWFVPQGGGMYAFSHDRAARFVHGCRDKVSCEKPELGVTTVEATCTCAWGDLDIAIGDRSRRVRYLWDGRAVRAEQ